MHCVLTKLKRKDNLVSHSITKSNMKEKHCSNYYNTFKLKNIH